MLHGFARPLEVDAACTESGRSFRAMLAAPAQTGSKMASVFGRQVHSLTVMAPPAALLMEPIA